MTILSAGLSYQVDFYSQTEPISYLLERRVRQGPATRIFPVLALPEGECRRLAMQGLKLSALLLPSLVSLESLIMLQQKGLAVRSLVDHNFELMNSYLMTQTFVPEDDGGALEVDPDSLNEWAETSQKLLLNEVKVKDPFASGRKKPPNFPAFHLLFPEYELALAMNIPGGSAGDCRKVEIERRRYCSPNRRALFRRALRKSVTFRVIENVSPYLPLECVLESLVNELQS